VSDTKTATEAPQSVEGSPAWVDLAKARLKAYSAQIDRLKAENLNLKRTVKHMERRILRSEHKDD
jgi:predicted RNase H-like nuclease (RuvC/YqgF family)